MKRAPRSVARPPRLARSRDEGAKLARTRSTLKKEEDEQITPRKRDPEVKEVADWVTEYMKQHPDEVWLIKNHVQKGAHKLSRRRKQPGELTPFLDSVTKIMHIRGEIIDAALQRADAKWADHLRTVRAAGIKNESTDLLCTICNLSLEHELPGNRTAESFVETISQMTAEDELVRTRSDEFLETFADDETQQFEGFNWLDMGPYKLHEEVNVEQSDKPLFKYLLHKSSGLKACSFQMVKWFNRSQ